MPVHRFGVLRAGMACSRGSMLTQHGRERKSRQCVRISRSTAPAPSHSMWLLLGKQRVMGAWKISKSCKHTPTLV
jgi:hypothetical protein